MSNTYLSNRIQDIVTGLTSLTLDTKAAERTIKTRQSSSRSERYTGPDVVDISDAFHDYVISQIDLPTYLLEIAAVVRGDRNLGNTLAPLLKDYRDAVDDVSAPPPPTPNFLSKKILEFTQLLTMCVLCVLTHIS